MLRQLLVCGQIDDVSKTDSILKHLNSAW